MATIDLVDLARRLAKQCHNVGALFIVNDRLGVALAAEADGVHLGPDDMPPADARRIAGPDFLIGVSVSSVDEARSLVEHASYLGVGAIFGTSTKHDAGEAIGVAPIREIKAAFPDKPVVAIGGVNAGNLSQVIDAGADCAAVVSAVIAADDMEAATRALCAAFC
jgi:thiamine-phosphate pyrophosphorylase